MSDTRVKLSQLKPGQTGRLVKINDAYPQKALLEELGFTVCVEIRLLRKAPLGDLLQIRLRDTDFAIRRGDADNVELERCQ